MSPGRAPRLYLITDRNATGGRPLPAVVAAALAGAAPYRGPDGWLPVAVQLREKDLDARALVALGRELARVTASAGAALWINDRVDVALACGAAGVHLPGGALAAADVRAVAPGLGLARSVHSVAEIDRALADELSFVVFGPVYDTPSKRAYGSPLGLQALRAAARAGGDLPVIALGGVDGGNARACAEAGAWGVACIRAVLSAPDPGAVVAALLENLR